MPDQSWRDEGILTSLLDDSKKQKAGDSQGRERENDWRRPGDFVATDTQSEKKRCGRSDEDACSGIVQSTEARPRGRRHPQRNGCGAQPQRNVDPEDRAPAEVLREDAPNERTERAGKGKIGSEPSLESSPLLRRNHLADQRLRQGHQTTTAKTLQRASTDEDGEAGSNRARSGTPDEQSERPDQHALSSECVSHAAVERGSDGRGE